MPTYELKVRHSVTAHEEDALNETGYLVSYEILETSDSDIPLELFLFRRMDSQRIDLPPHTVDNFITVCTLEDTFEYPANIPDCDKLYFRKAKVSGVRSTVEEANRIILRIEDLLTSLLRSYKLVEENMGEVERIIKV